MQPSASPKKIAKEKVEFQVNPRVDAIRSKLIYTFFLIDHFEGLSHAVPRHNIQEFVNPKKRKKLMLMDHHQLVRFNVMPTRNVRVTEEKRFRNRIEVRCRRWPPLKMWISSALNSRSFKGFMLFIITLNLFFLMLELEVNRRRGIIYEKINWVLELYFWVTFHIYAIEILLHWFVSFRNYWSNPWNIFDFTVTWIPFLPAILILVFPNFKLKRLVRTIRVTRALKLLPRVRQLRILIMAIGKALKEMTFILVLLAFLFYVFAVSGVFFFESYTHSDRTDLDYQMYFMDMPNSLVTIFILFTMDHWYALLLDLWKVPEVNKVISGIFVCLWLLIGAFIFRNLLVASMVTNFQTIRNDLTEEFREIQTQKQADKFKMEIMERRFSQIQRALDQNITFRERFTMDPALIQNADKPDFKYGETSPGRLDWETYIHNNLPGLYAADEDEQVLWPRDSLFCYFELLEKLQYNLEERKELQRYMVSALSNLEDK